MQTSNPHRSLRGSEHKLMHASCAVGRPSRCERVCWVSIRSPAPLLCKDCPPHHPVIASTIVRLNSSSSVIAAAMSASIALGVSWARALQAVSVRNVCLILLSLNTCVCKLTKGMISVVLHHSAVHHRDLTFYCRAVDALDQEDGAVLVMMRNTTQEEAADRAKVNAPLRMFVLQSVCVMQS